MAKHLKRIGIAVVPMLLGSTTANSAILVNTSNQLGQGKTLTFHCVRLHYKVDLGEHQVANGESYTWSFSRNNFHTTQLSCQLKLQGAPDFQLDAFIEKRDSCSRDCAWVFTNLGVFDLRDGVWTFRYAWPNG